MWNVGIGKVPQLVEACERALVAAGGKSVELTLLELEQRFNAPRARIVGMLFSSYIGTTREACDRAGIHVAYRKAKDAGRVLITRGTGDVRTPGRSRTIVTRAVGA